MVNPKLPYRDRKLHYISQIAAALGNISSNLSTAFGPFAKQEIHNPSEEWEKQHKENQEANRREIEIEELKRANKINNFTARIAVLGLFLTAIISLGQLVISFLEYRK